MYKIIKGEVRKGKGRGKKCYVQVVKHGGMRIQDSHIKGKPYMWWKQNTVWLHHYQIIGQLSLNVR